MPYDLKQMNTSLGKCSKNLHNLAKICCKKNALGRHENSMKIGGLIDLVGTVHSLIETLSDVLPGKESSVEKKQSEQDLKEAQEFFQEETSKSMLSVFDETNIDKEIDSVLTTFPESAKASAKLFTTHIKNNYVATEEEARRLINQVCSYWESKGIKKCSGL